MLGTITGVVVGGPALKAPPPALPLPPTTALPLPPAANASASVLRAVLWGNAMVLWGNAMVLWGNASASVLRAVLCAMLL